MKRVFVADIKPGDRVADLFWVSEARLAPYRDESKGHYLHLILADRSGQVEARLWEGAEEVARWLAPGQAVWARAQAALYQDQLRLRLDQLTPAEEVDVDLSALLPVPSVDPGEALAAVHAAADRVVSAPLHALLQSFFGDGQFVEAFCLAPLNAPGQLLARTVQLLELAAPLQRMGASLDGDLVTAAILLHDAGHTSDFAAPTADRPAAWLDVPTLSDQLVTERLAQMADFPPELALRLRHAISAADDPARALTPEAAVLAHLRALQAVLCRQEW